MNAPSSPAQSPAQLISSRHVKGTAVFDDSGDKLGAIDTLKIDRRTGLIRYAVMEFGGLWGIGQRYYAIPWHLLLHVETLNGYLVPLTKSHLEDAPRFEEQTSPDIGEEYWDTVDEHYLSSTSPG
jgi:sporulation protein YlmC with PRC-barrel domain